MKVHLDHKIIREIIANDPGFEIEVRRGILASAIKRGTEKLLCQSDISMVRKLVTEVMGEHDRPDSWSWKPNDGFKAKVSTIVSQEIDKVIEESVADMLNKVDEKLEQQVVKYLSEGLLAAAVRIIESKIDKQNLNQ